MAPFKRPMSSLLHLPPRFRRPLAKPATPPVNTAVAGKDPHWLRKFVRPAYNSTFLPQIDTDAQEVWENEQGGYESSQSTSEGVLMDEDELTCEVSGMGRDSPDEGDNIPVVDSPVDTVVSESFCDKDDVMRVVDSPVETVVSDDFKTIVADPEDTYTLSVDLMRKTRMEKVIQNLYVALSDDHDISALRTCDSEKFTHIVRITFEEPTVEDKLRPSAWAKDLSFPTTGPFELRLKCPTLALRLGHMALTTSQLDMARKYIAFSLPHRRDSWIEQGVKFPMSIEECQNARLLIVGPTDRSVDVMSIFVSYLSFLTGAGPSQLLDRIKKFHFVHPHWKNYALNNLAFPRQAFLNRD